LHKTETVRVERVIWILFFLQAIRDESKESFLLAVKPEKQREGDTCRRGQLVREIEERAAPTFIKPFNGLDHF
jgi:hypothetical protein